MGVLEATVPLSPKTTSHPFTPRRSRTIAAIIIRVLTGTLGAYGSSDTLEAANAWSLTNPGASAGGVALSLEEGDGWTSEGLALAGTNFATTQVSPETSPAPSSWALPRSSGHSRSSPLTAMGTTS